MLVEQVKKLSPLDRLTYWVSERENISLKKEAGETKPWTDDIILQSYRFCNVRRMDDKVSKWLLENWYLPFYNHPNMLLACAIARFFNKPESLGAITNGVFKGSKVDFIGIKGTLRKLKQKQKIFNGAYMVRGNDGIDKVECVLDYYVRPLLDVKVDNRSMEKSHAAIMASYGMGSFMAGQIVADLRWAREGTWKDKNVWAPIGPGSQRGMNRLLGLPIKTPMKQEEFNKQLTWMIDEVSPRLDSSIVNRLEAIDWQNTLCELDKYSRVLLGEEGKPKQKYPGK